MNLKLLLIVCLGLVFGVGLVLLKQRRPNQTKTSGPFIVPEELRYSRSEIPDSENAILDWIKADKFRTNLPATVKDGLQIAWNPNSPEPDEKALAAIRSAIRANEPALMLLDQSLSKPKAQWPKRDPQEEEPALRVLAELMRLRLFEAYEMQISGHQEKAATHLIDTLKIAQTAIDAEGTVVNYVIGRTLRTMTQQVIQSYAVQAGTRLEQLSFLLEHLPPLDAEAASFKRCVQVDLAGCAEKPFDPVKLAHQWTDPVGQDQNPYLSLVQDDLQRAFVVFLTPDLVSGHPAPVDHQAFVSKSAANFLWCIRNCRARWDQQEPELSGNNQDAIEKAFLRDADKVLKIVSEEALPLSGDAIAKVRSAYNRFENPVGRLLDAKDSSLDTSPRRVFLARTEREASRAVLGLQIFRLRNARMPDSLEQLVGEGILPAVPHDAFSSKPLRYSKDRGVIWSVGPDGRDDGGRDTPGKLYSGADVVWSVAVRKK